MISEGLSLPSEHLKRLVEETSVVHSFLAVWWGHRRIVAQNIHSKPALRGPDQRTTTPYARHLRRP